MPKLTNLRLSAFRFAQATIGSNAAFDVKVLENKSATRISCRPAYDVMVRLAGSSRGKCIGTLFDTNCF